MKLSSSSNYLRHKGGKGEKKLFSCKYCSKSFVTEASLKIHKGRWCPSLIEEKQKLLLKQQHIKSTINHVPTTEQENNSQFNPLFLLTSSNPALPIATTPTSSASSSLPLRRSERTPKVRFPPKSDENQSLSDDVDATEVTANTQNTHKHRKSGNKNQKQRNNTNNVKTAIMGNINYDQHPELRPHECRFCTVSFSTLQHRTCHENRSHLRNGGVKPYKCRFCHQRFYFEMDCKFHEQLHAANHNHNQNPNVVNAGIQNANFICGFCNCSYESKRRLKLHIKWRHGYEITMQNNYRGNIPAETEVAATSSNSNAGFSFAANSIMNAVAANKTSTARGKESRSKPKAGPSGTGKGFKKPPPLLNPEHLIKKVVKDKNDQEKLEYECNLCGENVQSLWAAVEHGRIHTEFKPFKCQYCQRNFSRTDSCRSHETSHTGESLFSCQVCQLPFRLKAALERHLKRVHGKI